MKLSALDRQGIKLASNYRHFRDDLMAFDYKRFRGLGETHTANFITCAVKICDSYNIYQYDAVLQIMKSMCFLGTYMLDDPRLDNISLTLKQPTTYGDTRIADFCKETREFLVAVAGPKLEHYRLILATLIEVSEQQMAPRIAREYILRSLPKHLKSTVNDWRPHLIQTSQSASANLEINDERFHTVSLMASAMLGHGFYKDPLYPWIRDLAKKDAHSMSDNRAESLQMYAVKRIRKQLTSLENYYEL